MWPGDYGRYPSCWLDTRAGARPWVDHRDVTGGALSKSLVHGAGQGRLGYFALRLMRTSENSMLKAESIDEL